MFHTEKGKRIQKAFEKAVPQEFTPAPLMASDGSLTPYDRCKDGLIYQADVDEFDIDIGLSPDD